MLILYGLIEVIRALGGHSLAQSHLGQILWKLLLVVITVESKLLVALIGEMKHQLAVVQVELLPQLVALGREVLVESADVLIEHMQNLVR